MEKKILVIDDDVELCNLLKQCLGNEGFQVNCLHDGKTGITFLKNNQVNLVILDVMLPEMDGFTILKQIRMFSEIPVLMLSAKSEEMNKVLGLKTGADDYITKPFGLSELIARVENLLRRCSVTDQDRKISPVLHYHDLEIDMDKCIVLKCNEIVQLTSKEYKLLCLLAQNPQKVFTKKQIYSNVWEEDFLYDDNTIMALISRLRKKLEDNQETPRYIQTVWGLGYRFHGEVD
ncbi:MAG TPA: response regulator transcription factor [Lachnospiraceae bacterium]|nr:response regulator transcription factor [Lachnospiraceae bacterium]